MNQREFFQSVILALEDLKISYMVVGSVASGAHGEPRMTQDIDLVVELRYGDAEELGKRFPSPEFYLDTQSVRNATQNCGQFSIIHGPSGNKVDMMLLQDTAWSAAQFSRRQPVELIDGIKAFVATPEDVILSKMAWYKEGGSDKHLRDITGILKVSGQSLNLDYINDWAKQLDVEDVWAAVVRRIETSNRGL